MAVDTTNGNVTAGNSGTWVTTTNKVNFEINLSGTTLLNGLLNRGELALHWGMTCGNDTIEGKYVLEPAILGLLAIGLIGIGISASKRKKHVEKLTELSRLEIP